MGIIMKNFFKSIAAAFEMFARARAAGVLARSGDRVGAAELMNGSKII